MISLARLQWQLSNKGKDTSLAFEQIALVLLKATFGFVTFLSASFRLEYVPPVSPVSVDVK